MFISHSIWIIANNRANKTYDISHLVDSTTVIHSNRDPRRIEIIEAIHIRDYTPTINSQKHQRLEKLALWGTKQQIHIRHTYTTLMIPTLMICR